MGNKLGHVDAEGAFRVASSELSSKSRTFTAEGAERAEGRRRTPIARGAGGWNGRGVRPSKNNSIHR